jgi:RNA polymerase sigma-70 factor (ECF subfamily)
VIAALATLLAFHGRARGPDDDARDEALLARHRDGDPDAFARIYRAHAAAVYRRLTRVLGPVPEREDLTQDVFLALYRALPRFRGEAKLTTLVHRIALNKAFEYLRRQSRRRALSADDVDLDDVLARCTSPEERVRARESLATVLTCLARIKPKKRIALLLRVVDGLSFDEIGELVDATPEAVAKRVQHGQRELDALMARAEAELHRRWS